MITLLHTYTHMQTNTIIVLIAGTMTIKTTTTTTTTTKTATATAPMMMTTRKPNITTTNAKWKNPRVSLRHLCRHVYVQYIATDCKVYKMKNKYSYVHTHTHKLIQRKYFLKLQKKSRKKQKIKKKKQKNNCNNIGMNLWWNFCVYEEKTNVARAQHFSLVYGAEQSGWKKEFFSRK